jgi:hypothetical protein
MIRSPDKKFGPADRAALTLAIGKEMERMIALEQLRPYEEPHPKGRCVYVIQLRDDVWDCPSCKKLFKGVKDRRTAFYVGSTGKSIAIRLEQHLAYPDHKKKNTTDAAQVAPHILRREPRLEPHDGPKVKSLEKRIKWGAEMRELEEFVLPRLIREAGFAVYAGARTNPDGTWKKKRAKKKIAEAGVATD